MNWLLVMVGLSVFYVMFLVGWVFGVRHQNRVVTERFDLFESVLAVGMLKVFRQVNNKNLSDEDLMKLLESELDYVREKMKVE